MTLSSGSAIASSDGKLSATGATGSVAIRLYIPQRMQVIDLSDNSMASGVLHKNICIEMGSLSYQLSASDATGRTLFSRQGDSKGKSCSKNGRRGNLAALSLTPLGRAFTLWVGPE